MITLLIRETLKLLSDYLNACDHSSPMLQTGRQAGGRTNRRTDNILIAIPR